MKVFSRFSCVFRVYDRTDCVVVIPDPTFSDALSADNVALITPWLQECNENHKRCNTSGAPYSPTRLVDVGNSNEDIHLVLRGDSPRSYAALTYCWGKPSASWPSFKTTKSNIKARLSSIPASELLLPTLQDVIQATRSLGMQYIWIDSLCIIQDCSDDWKKESADMKHIYANAYMTLSAIAARTLAEGFLVRPSPCSVEMPLVIKKGASDSVETGVAYFSYPSPSNITLIVDHTEWASRAWTFQEQTLSRRILYFTDQFVCFECGTHSKVEHGSKDLTEGTLRLPRPQAGDELRVRRPKDIWQSENIYQEWYWTVDNYTLRSLTYSEDRLRAISGLAHQFAQVIPDDVYLARLWKKDLLASLLSQPTPTFKTQSSRYYAPS